jgi:DMSO/TMAO reductase YedYZ molybdopterin-dependent catalytic subunit/thiosulfate reductase cytochrome b subunit
MIPHFTPAEKAMHYPEDRSFYVNIKPYMLFIIGMILIGSIVIAWIQYLFFGLPPDPSLSFSPVASAAEPSGFPMWINISHWVNFFFLVLIIRSGLSILVDHPRLYWNDGCGPDTQWIRFTPKKIPLDKVWTAKQDSRYISPVVGLPGYRHTVGIARSWHFLTVPFFILNGVIFLFLLLYTDQWKRLVPTSWHIIPDSWNVFVHYATFNMPVEPNGFYHFNALQQLAYFAVIFVMAPLAMLTGLAMSPAIDSRFPWYPKLFFNRQTARSFHFLIMFAYVIFIIVHVALVALTGLSKNMNHIILNKPNDTSSTGLWIGIAIILFVIGFNMLAYWISWRRPRTLQALEKKINVSLWRKTINKFTPRKFYTKKDISPYFWPNGAVPVSKEWKDLSANDFKDYKLKISGLVENPVELSLNDLKKMNKVETITMHSCIQGWTGIAEWGGVPISKIIDLVKPKSEATTLVFYSFGEGLYGGVYYDTETLDNCLKPKSILAWEMNYEPLPLEHGAPLRLRVENQLGYKMVKWISAIEFVETYKTIGKGFGGKNEDDEYFGLLADT